MSSVVCAWCGAVKSEETGLGGDTSHGICHDCAIHLEYEPESLQAFLESLPQGTLLVDADGRVMESNSAFLSLVGKERSSALGQLGGNVISCVYADLPGGCGRTTHCIGCSIRGAVNATRETGRGQVNPSGFAHIRTADGTVTLWFRITTQPFGAGVLLRVEPAPPPSTAE